MCVKMTNAAKLSTEACVDSPLVWDVEKPALLEWRTWDSGLARFVDASCASEGCSLIRSNSSTLARFDHVTVMWLLCGCYVTAI